jgi:hypothetical protein
LLSKGFVLPVKTSRLSYCFDSMIHSLSSFAVY